MEACHEYFNCIETDCKMFGGHAQKNCWEIEGTLCSHEGVRMARKVFSELTHEEICVKTGCIYHRVAHKSKA